MVQPYFPIIMRQLMSKSSWDLRVNTCWTF